MTSPEGARVYTDATHYYYLNNPNIIYGTDNNGKEYIYRRTDYKSVPETAKPDIAGAGKAALSTLLNPKPRETYDPKRKIDITSVTKASKKMPRALVSNAIEQGNSFTDYPISQGFGPTDEPLDGPYKGFDHFNKGTDYAIPANTPIRPTISGEVVAVNNDPDNSTGWGKFVWVKDPEGNVHQYGHLNSTSAKIGEQVDSSTVIGLSGSTGKSTGPHLSYDVRNPKGEYFDPIHFTGGTNYPKEAKPPPTPRKSIYGGNYATNLNKMLRDAESGWAGIDGLVSTNPNLQIDLKRGIVFTLDDQENEVLDKQASAMLQKVLNVENSIDRLVTARKEGAIRSGEDSAKAYLQSEKEKSGEAGRALDDYYSRLNEISSLESAMAIRAATISSAYRDSASDMASLSKAIYAGDLPSNARGFLNQPSNSQYDFRPHIANIGKTIPDETPRFRPISPSSMEPYQPPQFPEGDVTPWGVPELTGQDDSSIVDYFANINGLKRNINKLTADLLGGSD